MAKLILTLEGAFLTEQVIDKELITIGRRHNNDLQIDNLAVSGNHAVVRTVGTDSFLEDLDSTNGTTVNGSLIKKKILLQHGDIIKLGRYKIEYVDVANGNIATLDEQEKNLDFEEKLAADISTIGDTKADINAVSIQDEVTIQKTIGSGTTASQKPEVVTVGQIRVLNGPSAGCSTTLEKTLTTLGKPGVQVAVITKHFRGHFITHVEGSGDLLVNDQPIGGRAKKLKDHDVIDLGGVKMEFFLS